MAQKLYSINAQNIDDGTGLYNLSGLLIGVVVSDGSGSRKVRMLVNDFVKTNEAKPARPRIPADQVYENSLQITVQLFENN